jgi:hypothetical protein
MYIGLHVKYRLLLWDCNENFPASLILSTHWVTEIIRTGNSVRPVQNRLFRLGFAVNKVRSVQFSHSFARSLAGEYQPLGGKNHCSTFFDIWCHLACQVVSGNGNTVVQQDNWDGVLSVAVTYRRATYTAKHQYGVEQRNADEWFQ